MKKLILASVAAIALFGVAACSDSGTGGTDTTTTQSTTPAPADPAQPAAPADPGDRHDEAGRTGPGSGTVSRGCSVCVGRGRATGLFPCLSARVTRVLRPSATIAMTATANSTVSSVTTSCSISAETAMVTKACSNCTWLTRAMPPIASPTFQAKKPRNIEPNDR